MSGGGDESGPGAHAGLPPDAFASSGSLASRGGSILFRGGAGVLGVLGGTVCGFTFQNTRSIFSADWVLGHVFATNEKMISVGHV